MNNLGFAGLIGATFVVGYLGMAWLSKGAPVPVPVVKVSPLKPDPNLPTFAQVREGIERGVGERARVDWAAKRTNQGDGDAERDALRLSAIQAANAFSLSPCDPTIKKNFVTDVGAYAKAWTDKMGCKGMWCFGGKQVDEGATAFSTPLDMRVREAVSTAFNKGGVTVDDFPPPIRLWIMMLGQGQGREESPCLAGKSPARRKL